MAQEYKNNNIYPFIMIPEYKDYIWGGRNLEKFGKCIPEDNITAESWEVAAHPDGSSCVENGTLKGMRLGEILKLLGRKLIGSQLSERDLNNFPLLLKFIDANDRLSVQVHPDDNYAAQFGQYGKNEAWYIIDVLPGAQLIYGLKPGVDRETLKKAIEDDRIEEFMNYVSVKPGEVYNIPAGLLHAIGKGIMIAEIQQNSNLTFRVFDYNRVDKMGNKRPLHIKEALDVIKFDGATAPKPSMGLPAVAAGVPGDNKGGRSAERIIFAANRYFSLERIRIAEKNGCLHCDEEGRRFKIYSVIEGSMTVNYSKDPDNIKTKIIVDKGKTVLIPAELGPYSLEGCFSALVSYVPDMTRDILDPLIKAGNSERMIKDNGSIDI